MSYTVRVRVEVVNEDGEPVDYRGHIALPASAKKFTPLEAMRDMKTYERIEDAHATMNALFYMADNLKHIR